MEKRWKPEVGERYWRLTTTIEVIEDFWYKDCEVDTTCFESGNCFKTEDEAKAAAEKVKILLLGFHGDGENLKVNELPKLTCDVFDRPDCPEWARYAVVGGGGVLIFYEDKPMMSKDEYPKRWINYDRWIPVLGTKYDTSDWQNSLIERPAKKLPEWCKVGEWVYLCNGRYYKVESVNECHVNLSDGVSVGRNSIHSEMVSARPRPYNAEEMEAMVGLTVKGGNSSEIITGFKKNKWGKFVVKGACGWYDAKHLLENFTAYGSPCGVLEHLENGEWVK